jgi:hypothetical protein
VTDPHYYNLGRQIAANAKRQSEEALPYSMHVNRERQAALERHSRQLNYGAARKLLGFEDDVQETYTTNGKHGGEFITKDSGERTTFETGMQRDVTTGKPRYDLIDPEALNYTETMTYRHAMLMARGAEKYGDRNWEKARTDGEYYRFKQSAYRHFMQWFHGEEDEDHAAAVYFNIAGAEYVNVMQDREGI